MISTTWPKLLNVRFNPKLIKYTPNTFEINSIKYLADNPGAFLSSSMSLIIFTPSIVNPSLMKLSQICHLNSWKIIFNNILYYLI